MGMLIVMLMLLVIIQWGVMSVNANLATVEMENHAQLHVHQRVHMAHALLLILAPAKQGGQVPPAVKLYVHQCVHMAAVLHPIPVPAKMDGQELPVAKTLMSVQVVVLAVMQTLHVLTPLEVISVNARLDTVEMANPAQS